MDRLKSLQLFVEVVRYSSFSKAAEKMRLSRASASKTITALEQSLGTRLLMRSTHHVRPTEAGTALLKWAGNLIQDYETMEHDIKSRSEIISGEVHVGTPPSFGSFHIIPAIASFQDEFPGVKVFLHSDYGRTDLVQAGLDFSIRISTRLPDSSLYSQLLARVPQVLVASPAYLATHSEPHHPDDLVDHNCLVHLLSATDNTWLFASEEGERAVAIDGSFKSELGEALRSAALLGRGISMHPVFMLVDDLRAGRLKALMQEWAAPEMHVRAVYASNRHIPGRVRTFLDFLRKWFYSNSEYKR